MTARATPFIIKGRASNPPFKARNIPPTTAKPFIISFLIFLKVSVSPDIFAWIIFIALLATNPPKIAMKASPNLPSIPLTFLPTASTGFNKLFPIDLPIPSKRPSFFFFLSLSSWTNWSLWSCLCCSFSFSASVAIKFVILWTVFCILDTDLINAPIGVLLGDLSTFTIAPDPPNTFFGFILLLLNIAFLSSLDNILPLESTPVSAASKLGLLCILKNLSCEMLDATLLFLF